jgi:hypothetical protein
MAARQPGAGVLSDSKLGPVFSLEQGALALLLVIGMYFPSSLGGEHSIAAILAAFAALFTLLIYLVWKRGVRPEAAVFISVPIVVVLFACTILAVSSRPVQIDSGLFIKFIALALVLALDLRELRLGTVARRVFVVVNFLNILAGLAILIGNDWIGEFLPTYYWTSDPKLVPLMLSLHKPVLTFGSHALAGLFLYLFFLVNWEEHRLRGGRVALIFALSYLVLLVGLTSFTAFGLGALALSQMGLWYWKRNRRVFLVSTLFIAAVIPFVVRAADPVDFLTELPQVAEVGLLDPDHNGPLSRYGPEGTLRGEIRYLFDHPFSPIGLARSESAFGVETPSHFFVGDSGPLEYLTRGSVVLLFLIYFGLYRFLRDNLLLRSHATGLFLVIVAFETGYSALVDSSRTYFLLPFFVIYLNHVSLNQTT